MAVRPKQKAGKTQSERFIEAARALGCDEDEAAFDEKLKRIAQAKPKPKDQAGSGGLSEGAPRGGRPRRERSRPGSE